MTAEVNTTDKNSTIREGYVSRAERKKILLLSDDLR